MSQDGRNEVHDFRLAVERAINSTLVVGTATVGQNLQFGSGGTFEWVTPAGTSGGLELFTVRKLASLRV